MDTCVICGNIVDWPRVTEEMFSILERVDFYGAESLPDSLQLVYDGKCCSYECFDTIE